MFEYMEFCSNPDCDNKVTYLELDDPVKFCTKCGQNMIYECPDCKSKLPKTFDSFCPNCGKQLRKPPEVDSTVYY